MKKFLYLIILLPFIMISCDKIPVAQFSADTNEPEVGRPVLFTNESKNATKFNWDFGDGFTSNDNSPSHTFTGNSSYIIRLKATSKSGNNDEASLSLTVFIPTLLEIEVREYYSLDIIPGASVRLYPTLVDWDAQTNKVSEAFTDPSGKSVFSNLDPYVYYVDVWEATHDNYALRNEEVGWIRTPEILPHQINRFVAWVDVVTPNKGDSGGARNMVIKKLERKADSRSQPACGGTESWQDMYSRSVHLTK